VSRQLDAGLAGHTAQMREGPLPRMPPPVVLAPRQGAALLLALCLLCVLAAGWAWWARLDIVVTAPGRVVVSGYNRAVQATESGTLAAIHVTEGQQVAAGQLLLQFEDSALLAELTRLQTEARQLAAEQAVRAVNLACLQAAPCEHSAATGDSGPIGLTAVRPLAQWETYRATLAALDREVVQRQTLLTATRARLAALTRSVALLNEESQALAALQSRGMVPRLQWTARERERLAAVDALDTARGTLRAGEAELGVLAARRRGTTAQFLERSVAEQAETAARQQTLGSELARAALRLAATRRHAPIAGRVQALAAQAPGAVVGAGSTLLEIVPDSAPRIVEALVANRDVGMVRVGQAVVVKADAYNFSRYGALSGRVVRVAADAAEGADHQWRFVVGITLDQPGLRIDGQLVPLAPGMTVSVEFTLGQRRALDYLLDPLRRYRDEAAREP